MRKLLFLFAVLCTQLLYAQDKTVTGVVVSSEDGSPMIGVAVMDKVSMNGVITDFDGKFSITVPTKSKVLQFSYVGFKTKEQAISGKTMKVEMTPDVVNLEEVMVVAYGTGKKSSFTGSATVVKKESLEKVKVSNVTQALQGQSSGVQVINNSGEPGADASIMIRGIGSMNASSSPLYVVDGTAYNGYINAINPNDIESMTVLKDASATALYGSRAANGVIMITTKKGASEKGQINFRSTWGFTSLAVDLPRALTPQEFTELAWTGIMNGYLDQGYSATDAAQMATQQLPGELKINPWSMNNPVGVDGKLDPNAKLKFSGDWRDALLKSRLRQEYTMDFSGKSQKSDYFISAGYLNDKGVFSTQEYERFSVRGSMNYDVKKWMKVGLNANLSHSKRIMSAGSDVVWFLRTMPSIYPIYVWDEATQGYKTDSNGDYVLDYGDNRMSWAGWNPLADAKYNPSPWYHDDASLRTYFEIKFLPELTWRTNISLDYYLYHSDGYVNSEYGFAAGYGGEAYKDMQRGISYTINNLLTYNKTFGDHTINALLGQEAYARDTKALSASKRGFPFNGLTEINSASEMNSMGSWKDEYRLLSYFSRLEYDYANRYYVSASYRTDGSSRFHPDSRWGNFWSLGASWRISNEKFMEPYSEWLDNLKLKASYGAVGNDNLGTLYAYQGLYATGMNNYNQAGVMISRLPNKTLKWETNLQFNVGLDFAMFNKFSGTIEYFKRKSKDLLFTMPMAPSTGFGGIDRNIGDVENYGIEFTLNYVPFSSKDFTWTIDLNGTSYKNKITKLPQEEMNAGYFKWREGESRFNFWGVEYAGVNPETGNDQYWMVVDKEDGTTERVKTEDYNAVSSDKHKKYLGDALPKLFGGLTNSFQFKGIDFSFMIYYSLGGKLYDGDYAQAMAYRQGYSLHPDMLDAWTPENKNAKLPRFSTTYGNYMGSYSSKFLYDNTFFRLRNITLGYTLPKSLTSKFLINSLRVFAQADNILTTGSAQKRGTDPEQSIDGIAGNRFPVTKSVSFGLQLNF
ncbi:MAG: TonB-dependent receptor [Bacteroides sp.]|nr:TonB-dependent receptor [Bacteroides sp.]